MYFCLYINTLHVGIQTSKKDQSVYISALLLQPLKHVAKEYYSVNLFTQMNIKSGATRISQIITWHGALDGYCDLLPAKDTTDSKMYNEDDSHQAKLLMFPVMEKLDSKYVFQ